MYPDGSYAKSPAGTRAQFWCSDFAEWVANHAGVNTAGQHPADPGARHWKDWALAHGTWHDRDTPYSPRVGDLIVWGGHVGVVIGVNAVDKDGRRNPRNVLSVNGNSGLANDADQSVDVDTHVNKYVGGSTVYYGRGGFLGFATLVNADGSPISTPN